MEVRVLSWAPEEDIHRMSRGYAQLVPGYRQEYDFAMKQRLLHSASASLEWRVIAFLITEAFFLLTTGNVWQATILALELQLILFIGHFAWFFVRESKAHS